MIDPTEFETTPKQPNYAFAYVVIVLGVLTIGFHYTVLPHILAQYNIPGL